MFSLLEMSIVIGKSVNFLTTKFTPKAGQIYPQLRTPALDNAILPLTLIKYGRLQKKHHFMYSARKLNDDDSCFFLIFVCLLLDVAN